MDFILIQSLNGLATASSLFLVAAGLSIIFGVSRIVNFAHGSLYMIGAFIAYSCMTVLPSTGMSFWVAVGLAAVAVGGLGIIVNEWVLKRLYGGPELLPLLATFGLALIAEDLVIAIWGPEDRLGPQVSGLDGSITLMGQAFPVYDLVLIGVGLVVLGALWWGLHKTQWGILVRAATQDREMVSALGHNPAVILTSVVAVGAGLAGLGGALQVPRETLSHLMASNIIAEAFVVVVVGGMGSVVGAFWAAVVIGELQAFGIVLFPRITLILIFLIMAVVLTIRPWGLLGRPKVPVIPPHQDPIGDGRLRWVMLGGALLLPWIPLLGQEYLTYVMTELCIFALFAASVHGLMTGGIDPFGQAAYFGLGSYAVALSVKMLSWPMMGSLAASVVTGGVGGLLLGWLCVRLSGVYLAMLTLAFAQILYAIAFQWYEVTGGDNGILGVWPAEWAAGSGPFYYLVLGCCSVGILALRWGLFTPFGYALRAVRDSPQRAEAIGLSPRRYQWQMFGLAGMTSGLAGGLYAFFNGSVFPDVLGIQVSIDGLVMVLLGGVQSLSGPVIGSFVYKAVQIQLSSITDSWRLGIGVMIVVLVVIVPQGLAGLWRR